MGPLSPGASAGAEPLRRRYFGGYVSTARERGSSPLGRSLRSAPQSRHRSKPPFAGEIVFDAGDEAAITHGDSVLPPLGDDSGGVGDEMDRLGFGAASPLADETDAADEFDGLFRVAAAAEERESGAHLASFFEGKPPKSPPPKSPPPAAGGERRDDPVVNLFDGGSARPARGLVVPLRRVEDKRLVFVSSTLGFTLALFQDGWLRVQRVKAGCDHLGVLVPGFALIAVDDDRLPMPFADGQFPSLPA